MTSEVDSVKVSIPPPHVGRNGGIFAKIRDMIRLIKKWKLLRNLYKICQQKGMEGTTESVLEHRTMFRKTAFVKILALQSLSRFGRKTASTNDLNKKIYEYNSIIEECFGEGYIQMDKEHDDFIFTTPKADAFMGWFPLSEKLLSEYKITWTAIIIPLAVGVYGSHYLIHFFAFIFSL